jgi:thiamine pyrophosphate-dependent acetolactate synthase large subunit-like protein
VEIALTTKRITKSLPSYWLRPPVQGLSGANLAEALGCQGIRIEAPEDLAPALATGTAERHRPTLLDVVVTRDPAKMLPGVDSRTLEVKPGDRPV